MADSGYKIFIGNINENVRKSELRLEFSKFGEVVDMYISTGYAFISYGDQRSASDAIANMDGVMYMGEKLRVEPSRGRSSTGGARGDGRSDSGRPPPLGYEYRGGRGRGGYDRGRGGGGGYRGSFRGGRGGDGGYSEGRGDHGGRPSYDSRRESERNDSGRYRSPREEYRSEYHRTDYRSQQRNDHPHHYDRYRNATPPLRDYHYQSSSDYHHRSAGGGRSPLLSPLQPLSISPPPTRYRSRSPIDRYSRGPLLSSRGPPPVSRGPPPRDYDMRDSRDYHHQPSSRGGSGGYRGRGGCRGSGGGGGGGHRDYDRNFSSSGGSGYNPRRQSNDNYYRDRARSPLR